MNNKIILLEVYEERIFYENTGLHRVAAYLKNSGMIVHLEYIKLNSKIDDNLLIKFNDYSFLGIAVYDINFDYILRLTHELKKKYKNLIIFYGSQYVTLTYKSILKYDQYVDFLVLGDGEYPTHFFICNYNQKNLDELINSRKDLVSRNDYNNKSPNFTDINKLPWPIHDKKIIKENLYCYLQTTTGCFGDCTFCARIRRDWSWYSPKKIEEEIINICDQYNIRAFIFADSNFGDPGEEGKDRILKFLDLIEKHNEKYAFCAYTRSETYKDTFSDINLLKRMRNVGFVQMFVGIEAGSQDDLNVYEKRADINENNAILSILKKCGIEPIWGFMMINPYSTKKSMLENYNFLVLNSSYIPIHFMNYVRIYKNTKLYYNIIKDNLLANDKFNDVKYKFVDNFVERIFKFSQENFETGLMAKVSRNIRDSVRLYLYLSVILGNLQKEGKIVEEMKCKLSLLNKNYFKHFFYDNDFNAGLKNYDKYLAEIAICSEQLEKVKLSAVKKYYKYYGM